MTCIDAGIFYGVKLRKVKGSSFLNSVLIILYKQLNNIVLTKQEKKLAENLKSLEVSDEESEEKTTTSSSSSAKTSLGKRRKVDDDEVDDDDDEEEVPIPKKKAPISDDDDEDEEEEDDEEYDEEEEKGSFDSKFYQLLTKAQESLGFSIQTSKGNTWNGSGFKCLLVFEPVQSDNCTKFDLEDLAERERNVSDEQRKNVASYLKMIGHSPSPLSWYLYPGAG